MRNQSILCRFILLCGLCIAMMTARAQYVAIPDSNFGKWLYANGFDTAMTGNSTAGWQLDTMNNLVRNTNTLDCVDANIHDLTGIQYFKVLTYLYCGGNQLSSLPTLTGMIHLSSIICDSNQLTTLPDFPHNLTGINCDNNLLTSLPDMMHLTSGFTQLSCSNNPLGSLPPLPSSLTYLTCENCQLSSLPDLWPNLTGLDIRYNPNITCLPAVPPGLFNIINFDGTGITCMPNRFNTSVHTPVNPDSLPLCIPASGCPLYYNISGNVHFDTASTCQQDSLFPMNKLSNIKIQLIQNGQVEQQFYTMSSYGEYSFRTGGFGTYSIAVDTAGLPLSVACPSGGTRTDVVSAADSLYYKQNFGLTCGVVDYNVDYISNGNFRPGTYSPVYITAGNNSGINNGITCGAAEPGTVTTMISGPVSYFGPAGALSPSSVSGNILTYNIADLNTLQANDLSIYIMTDSLAMVGTPVCITTIISPSVPDANPSDDTLTFCGQVVNAHDPNYKAVYPVDTFHTTQWLTYTIGFENTGNDTAFTVVVRDTLSQHLRAESFQYLGSSSHVVIQLFGNAMVFTFPHINLPDSAVNPAGSQGWIQYRVLPQSGLSPGTNILNTAYVYFDANPSVVTNTTVNVYDTVVPFFCSDTTILLTHAICAGDSFLFGTTYLTAAGTYIDSMPRVHGCDSVFVLTLTVNPLPVVSFSWDSLLLQGHLYSYPQDTFWCDNLYSIFAMSGGSPPGGIYAANNISNDTIDFELYPYLFDTIYYTYTDTNGCRSTVSDTLSITECGGINNIPGSAIIYLYPNPNNGSFTLQTTGNTGNEYTITDMLGDVVTQKKITSDTETIELPGAGEGVYTLLVKGALPVRFVIVR